MKQFAILVGLCCCFSATLSYCKKDKPTTQQPPPTPPPPPQPPPPPPQPPQPLDQSKFASPAEINKRLGRGVNLGNYYEFPPGGGGKEATPADFKRIADIGFKHIRIPIRWELAGRTAAASPYTVSPSFLAQVKGLVDNALKNKLHVVFNMHNHAELFDHPETNKPMFLAQWKQIAEYFRNYPDSLLFEVLNEPHGPLDGELWNTYLADALKEIRKTNSKRTVFIDGPVFSGVHDVHKLIVPTDGNLILTIHYYNPFVFTHQGASWIPGANAWLGIKWNDAESDRQVVINDFKNAIQFAKSKSLPINIGEFGAFGTADMDSRVKWTRFLARWFELQGFSWSYWEYSEGFGMYDPSIGQFRKGLADALTKDQMVPATLPTVLAEVYSSNFSSGQSDGWGLYNNHSSAASTMAIADNKLNVTITSPGNESWLIQLIRGNTAIQAGKTYQISFNAYSNIERTIFVTMQQSSSPWAVYANTGMTITATDAVYRYIFTATTTDANTNFVFGLGNSGLSPVTIHNIKLQEVSF